MSDSKPKIADTKPVVLDLESGIYYWCSCGGSANQPFCDGSHQGTEFQPLKFSLEEAKKVALCNCKSTQNSPFCDGSHSQLTS
jgi:CDGSH iron-sulfur domain-containing protein 3